MKKKFVIPFVLIVLSFTARAQSEKTDTMKAAKEVILKNNGEKDLPQQLQRGQLNQKPAMLNSDTTSTKPISPSRHKCCKKKASK